LAGVYILKKELKRVIEDRRPHDSNAAAIKIKKDESNISLKKELYDENEEHSVINKNSDENDDVEEDDDSSKNILNVEQNRGDFGIYLNLLKWFQNFIIIFFLFFPFLRYCLI